MSWIQFCEINYIPPHLFSCSIENLKQFQEEAFGFLEKPYSMLLMGDCGRGKTYFLLALIHGLLEIKKLPLHLFRFFNASDLEERVDQEIQLYRSATYFLNTLRDVRFLFIDDFGVEKTRERAERNYYKITDTRLGEDKPTVFSTNLTDEEILNTYGARINSRLGNCTRLNFTGPDFRNPSQDLPLLDLNKLAPWR